MEPLTGFTSRLLNETAEPRICPGELDSVTGCSPLVDPQKRNALQQPLAHDSNVRKFETGVKGDDMRKLLSEGDAIGSDNANPLHGTGIDLTEQNVEADALRRSEEKYRNLVENSLQGVAIIQNNRFVFCNPAFAAMFGYSVAELLSFPDSKVVVHPDDRELVRKRYEDRMAGNSIPHHYEHRIIRKDGAERWVEIYTVTIEYDGSPAVQLVSIDVTERKQAELTLRESKEYLNQIINCIGDSIFVKDRQHRFVLTNDAICSLVGMPREEMIGRTLLDNLPKEILEPLIELEEQIFETGKPSVSVEEIQGITGQRSIAMSNKTLLTDANGQKQMVGVIRDITELKAAEKALRESEESYRTAIEHCNDGVAIAREGINLFANQRYVEMFGYDGPEEVVGKPASLIAHPDDIKRMEDILLGRQRGESVPSRYELKGIRKDGEAIDIEISATRTVYRGEPVSLAYVRDITERKRMEKEREMLQEQVRQSQKLEAIGLLAGGVAHDFNNLLSVINGYSELLLAGCDRDDPRRGDLEQIMQAGQRAASLTSQLLAFSRKQILQPSILNLNDVITDMGKMLRRMIGEDIEFVCVTRPGLGFVHADPGQIQQIIMNLVVNARDAMPQGGKLSIETANVDLEEHAVQRRALMSPGSYIMLAISDNGIGMDEETQDRIFDPFFSTKERGKGTGLGLATVYGIVKQSLGFIWVYSERGKGTTFKIYLPRMQGEAAEPSDGVKEEPDLRGTETVLLAEDEPSVRALAGRILRERGYTVIEGANGEEALSAAQEFAGEIHVVLTDVVMPEMSGKVLVSQIEASRPGIKSLFISGYTDNAIVHHGLLESNVAFLQKPFSADGLARKVREVIDS